MENHKTAVTGRRLWGFPSATPCLEHGELGQVAQVCVQSTLTIFKDRDSKTSLGHLFQLFDQSHSKIIVFKGNVPYFNL